LLSNVERRVDRTNMDLFGFWSMQLTLNLLT